MMKYRKLPVVIEAELLSSLNSERIAVWCNGTVNSDRTVSISTLEGVMRCDVGDYVIKGVSGEFYPCKPEIFTATYEVA